MSKALGQFWWAFLGNKLVVIVSDFFRLLTQFSSVWHCRLVLVPVEDACTAEFGARRKLTKFPNKRLLHSHLYYKWIALDKQRYNLLLIAAKQWSATRGVFHLLSPPDQSPKLHLKLDTRFMTNIRWSQLFTYIRIIYKYDTTRWCHSCVCKPVSWSQWGPNNTATQVCDPWCKEHLMSEDTARL